MKYCTYPYIKSSNFVLDLGSGHNPHPMADVLVDKTFSNKERGGELHNNWRPLIVANGENLPFQDKTFDYVVCRHVLEHSKQPNRILGEMERVSKRGYIETPTKINEFINYERSYHNLVIIFKNKKLIIQKKGDTKYGKLGKLIPYLMKDKLFQLLWRKYNSLFTVRAEWEETIDYRIVDDEEDEVVNLSSLDIIEKISCKGKSGWIKKWIVKYLIKSYDIIRMKMRKYREDLSIEDISRFMRCIKCDGGIEYLSGEIVCGSCGTSFSMRQGTPILK